MKNRQNAKSILITGMHRSGTSMVTRIVNLLGIYIGEKKNFLNPNEYNPEGYWELNDIVHFHDRLLRHFNLSWKYVYPLPDNWHLSKEINAYKEELKSIIKKNYGDREIWAWKDPRTSIVFPIWKSVLDELGIEVICIFVYRNPLDVAKSLYKRDGISYDKSFGLWLIYNLNTLLLTLNIPKIFLSYDKLIIDWKNELKKLALFLDIKWSDVLESKINSFIKKDFCHSMSTFEDLKNVNIPYPVLKLYELLINEINILSKEDIYKKINYMYNEFATYIRLFQEDISMANGINQAIEEKDKQIKKLNQKLEIITNSCSWKLTKPLRVVNSTYKLFRKKIYKLIY